MMGQKEGPEPNLDPRNKTQETAGLADYKKRFEEAVADAQYLMMYASSNCPNDIKRNTIEKLVDARLRVERHEEITPKVEADFWLAYQEIWKLVKPVTAESVKANLSFEGNSAGSLFGKIPYLSRSFGVGASSKAGKTVNRYIVFTVIVLIVLLILQIYWVIGSQLTTQLADLLHQEAQTNLLIQENQQEYNALEIRYKQNEIESDSFKSSGTYTFYSSPEWERDVLENISQKSQLEADLELLKSQLERNSAILLIWSGPWDGLINKQSDLVDLTSNADETKESNLTASDEYALQIKNIQAQIDEIDKQLTTDSDGMDAAELLNSTLTPRLNSIDEQLGKLYADNNDLYVREAEIQSEIDDINAQLGNLSNGTTTVDELTTNLNVQLTDLKTQRVTIEGQIESIKSQLSAPPTDTSGEVDESLNSAFEAQLTGLEAEKQAIDSQITRIENQLSAISGNTDALKNLEIELIDLDARKKFNIDQIQSLQSESKDLVARLVPAGQIVTQWNQDKLRLTNELNTLIRQAQADARRENSRQAQLAGQFVLVVLQSYLLPLLYGILGAGSSVLRTLSKQIKDVTYSEEARIQHLLRISLGALAGIMVGWFSFLLPTDEATSFLGSVSPLAIAFLVGYNIELFFSTMDIALNKVNAARQRTSPPAEKEDQMAAPRTESDASLAQATPPADAPSSTPSSTPSEKTAS